MLGLLNRRLGAQQFQDVFNSGYMKTFEIGVHFNSFVHEDVLYYMVKTTEMVLSGGLTELVHLEISKVHDVDVECSNA